MTAEEAPALRAVPRGKPARFPVTLPEQHVDIIGRHTEFDRIRALLAEPATRLVTLVGPGGVGKTTLAVATGRELWARFDGAVLYVTLAPATSADEVVAAIAQAAGWATAEEAATVDAVVRGLGDAPALLVLDNCEQIEGLAVLLNTLLSACSEVVVLATSRRPVGLAAERLVQLDPLQVPEGTSSVRELTDNAAAIVLVNAARRRNPSFSVTRDNAGAIAALCRRLDGLPLALELAAARLHLLPPQQLLDLLAHRFDVLKVDAADKDDRHRRLWATIDWSYQLLDDTDRARFRALGVFADGFALDGAAAVAGCTPIEMLDTLDRLVAEQLVRSVADQAGLARFDLLESIREFAHAELDARGELDATIERHAEWVRELVERWGPALIDGDEQGQAAAVLDAERANVQAALHRSLDARRPDRVLAIGTSLWRYWWYRGLARQGRTWLETALDQGPDPTPATAAAYVVASDLAEVTGDLTRARELIGPALAIFEHHGSDEQLAQAWNGLGFVERELGNLDRARELHELALSTSTRLGRQRTQAAALNGLGAVATRSGDNAGAIANYRAALVLIRQLGDRYAAALIAQNLATALFANGELDTAITTLREVLDESRLLGDVQNELVTLLNLADCEIAAEQLDAAADHLDDAARTAEAAGIAHYPAVIAHHRGRIADRRGQIGEALALYASGLEIALQVVRPIETIDFLERIGALAAELGDDQVAERALATARLGRSATGTPAGAEVAHWEAALAERGTVVAAPDLAGAWPQPAAEVLPELAVFARARAKTQRQRAQPGPADDPLCRFGLTPREAEVARLVSARRTDQEIADQLFVAVRTANTHVSAVLRKLGVGSRRDVAARLAELGVDSGR